MMTLAFDNENKGKPTFTFVVATQTTEEDWREGRKELTLLQSLARMTLAEADVKVWVEFGNKEGLPTVYNKALTNIEKSEYIVFTHDDITLNDAFFFDTIISSKFDVIGAVGGKAWGIPGGFDLEHRPLIWTVATCGKGASGFMNHDLKNGCYLPSSYGYAPLETMTLDGSIIIFTRKAVEKGLRWDENFKFHWYDMDICAQAHKLGLRVGTAPILLTHGSVGASVAQPQFMEGQRRFVEKWLK